MTDHTTPLRRFEADLLPMLADAAREQTSWQRKPRTWSIRWRRVAFVAATITLAALVVPLVYDDPLRGAIAIEQRGDTVYLSVRDATADPEAMTNDLRAYGLPARVEVVPVSPSLEGTWVDIVNDNLAAGYNDPRIVEVFNQMEKRPAVLELPADFSTPFTLVVGRPTEAGERYLIANAVDTEDVQGCLGVAGVTVAEGQQTLEERGFEVMTQGRLKDVILRAELLGPTTVILDSANRGGGWWERGREC